MVNAKTAFKEKNYVKNPFGTSKAGLLCESLNNLFRDKRDEKIPQWIHCHIHAVQKLPIDTPIIPLLLCAAYAAINQHHKAYSLLDFCLKNKAVWKNLSTGNVPVQNRVRQVAIQNINFHLDLGRKLFIDLLTCAILDGEDPFLIQDVVRRTKKIV